jgi:Tfp pilus assembly protein PilN
VRPLNLASQPFRNETLPAVLIVLGGLLLAGLTAQHALTIRRLLPAQTSAAHQQAAALEQEAGRLRSEARDLRVPRPEAPVIAQWVLLKELVDRRAFSWTGLFAVLEQVLPYGVRMVSIAPRVEKDVVTIELDAATRSYEQGLELIRMLEDRPEFAQVFPVSRGNEEESRFRYTMRYLPQAAPPDGVPPASTVPAPPAGDGEGEETADPQARSASLDGARR